ncbi:MAG: diacylglycerol kinase family protein [Kiritimatiellaeota bacterium]|nr:diacylglycerol kinase family protein [Kiritimatiellota bacterium]
MKKMGKPFTVKARLGSFRFAFAGIWTLLRTQHNMRVHLAAALAAAGCGAYAGLSAVEWCVIVLTVMAVWVAEAFNTAVEFLADRVSTDYHPLIKCAKDVAAGAVLITAIGAVVIGAIIFLPYVLGR